tara:strand:+ start:674 stop:931 length:258 start_codon:yes stop_codon:yes gene_type:complete
MCPDCGNNTGCRLSRGLYQCHRCHHQISLTAGTVFHGTHLPLTTWFWLLVDPAQERHLSAAAVPGARRRTPPMPYRFLKMADFYA